MEIAGGGSGGDASTGHSHLKRETHIGAGYESTTQIGQNQLCLAANADSMNSEKLGGTKGTSLDRLVYVLSFLRGEWVKVHVKDGSIISGIFYGAETGQLSQILLKKATVKWPEERGSYPVTKPLTMILCCSDVFQIVAENITLDSGAEEGVSHLSVAKDAVLYDEIESQETKKTVTRSAKLSSICSSDVLKEPPPSEYGTINSMPPTTASSRLNLLRRHVESLSSENALDGNEKANIYGNIKQVVRRY